MTDSRTAPYASLLLRLALGILFLAHFSLKFFVFTPAGTANFLPPRSAWRAGVSHHGG
jgi:putative oxidoreductase